MRWNTLKKRLEDNFHLDVKKRIKFQFTRYPGSHDGSTVLRLLIDGETIMTAASLHYIKELNKEINELFIEDEEAPLLDNYRKYRTYNPQARENLAEKGIMDSNKLIDLMEEYLSMCITDAIKSDHPFIRALALLDKRVGSRTIAKFDVDTEWHPLVKECHKLRSQKVKNY